MNLKFRSRRFLLAVFFSITTTVLTFKGMLEGGSYVAAITIILGLYGGMDTAQQVMNKDK